MARLELIEREDRLWDWHLLADNGEIQCQSSQGFRDEADAERGALDAVAAVVRLAVGYQPSDGLLEAVAVKIRKRPR